MADALAELADLEFWNGGGSGSVESTVADPVVTEVAAGSGLLVPGLFDHYRSFAPRPAAFFGLRVSRKPSPGLGPPCTAAASSPPARSARTAPRCRGRRRACT